MWSLFKKKEAPNASPIFLTNTLSGRKETFAPYKEGVVNLYSCGPTVYDRAHIGNLRAYVFSDLIARTLTEAGYGVRRVINITDVGHLVGDADEGEDKIQLAARAHRLSPEEIATTYTDLFKEDVALLNLDVNSILFPRATEYVTEQIEMIKTLEAKGHTYLISDGLYFDTSTFPGYGKLGGTEDDSVKVGSAATLPARAELLAHSRIKPNEEKRHPEDFALWRRGKANDLQKWNSPWGFGNPGWHIECSAMIRAILGDTIDIHTGGMDHIVVHHNNEIAQSESATGRPLARYWMHLSFLTMMGDKISKSLKNDVYLSEIVERGLHPLSLRYFFLQAHYRTPLSFSWEALEASNEALHRLWKLAEEVGGDAKGIAQSSDASRRIVTLLRDDLATPQALALLWESLKDDALTSREAWGVVVAAEPILGLLLTNPPIRTRAYLLSELPEDIQEVVQKREAARRAKNFIDSDRLRIHLESRGYRVDDGPSGQVIRPGGR